jgi:aryl-alcohol dehydrogenase-like predicted oxidoreductase
MSVRYRLGASELEVTPIGLGCWQFSRSRGLAGSYWPAIPQQTVREIVQVSLEDGINWFDTAEVYGKGASEEALADALKTLQIPREQYLVADKWFPAFRWAGSIRSTFPAREQALQGISIDLHQIHQPFSFSSVEKQAAEMGRLVRDGRVRAVGVSNFNEAGMRRAHARLALDGVPLATNQMRYSLLDREIERNGVLDTARELGITIIAYSPLAQGILTGKFHGEEDIRQRKSPRKWMGRFKPQGLKATRPLVEELQAIASSRIHDEDSGNSDAVTPAQISLAWVTQRHGESVVAIPGATSVNQARSNAKALRIKLTTEELDRLDLAGREAEKRLKKLG